MTSTKFVFGMSIVGALLLVACQPTPHPNPNPNTPTLKALAPRPPYDGVRPDPARTPGAANPDITQANIGQTICNPHWTTKSIRPPVSYTNALKKNELSSGYDVGGDTNMSDYELDHLISLEIGGDPRSELNLWPEKWNNQTQNGDLGAHTKDKVENAAHKAVCAGQMTLIEAQQKIARDWVSFGHDLGVPGL